MYWIREMQSAIGFIEGRLTEELRMEDIARSAHSFPRRYALRRETPGLRPEIFRAPLDQY
jgi:hypothetical protein